MRRVDACVDGGGQLKRDAGFPAGDEDPLGAGSGGHEQTVNSLWALAAEHLKVDPFHGASLVGRDRGAGLGKAFGNGSVHVAENDGLRPSQARAVAGGFDESARGNRPEGGGKRGISAPGTGGAVCGAAVEKTLVIEPEEVKADPEGFWTDRRRADPRWRSPSRSFLNVKSSARNTERR